jgi:hypothetical protein
MNIIDYAMQYVGIKQGSKKHKEIIDGYNNNCLPLARGYKVTYTDSWCATFVSYVLKMCGNDENFPFECSVYYMTKNAKSKNLFVKTPKKGYVIVYDWSNNGTLDHVGIITEINGTTLTVVEGNKSKQVGTRTIKKSSNEIYGYIKTNYTDDVVTTDVDIDTLVKDTISGKYGNGETRKKLLGSNYEIVQQKVNEILSQK